MLLEEMENFCVCFTFDKFNEEKEQQKKDERKKSLSVVNLFNVCCVIPKKFCGEKFSLMLFASPFM